jgi:hypothetical protein
MAPCHLCGAPPDLRGVLTFGGALRNFGGAPPNSWECPDFGAARLPARRAVDDQRNGAFSELRIGGKVLRAAFR